MKFKDFFNGLVELEMQDLNRGMINRHAGAQAKRK